ncbi:hypothetical protein SAMN05444392_10728 [Seinonella peptonophila]|uniref:DUF458 domain-containing protein n=1 Tax=Seinonella peptonophila TaxID=112248 RepID=A0A1M4YLP9_9BACL|nr:ribonuclease H-like YkuK family protein [Seinonella peptonophila]SHF06700.1 hypothetical protein SAMN05444392_10728 [Seinonella peptonophila]
MIFFHPRKGPCSIDQMTRQIRDYIKEDANAQYKVVIGTDSQTNNRETLFVTAVIIQRLGKGALFYTHKRRHPSMKDLRSRIYTETEYSLDCVELLKGKFSELLEDVPLEIHLDVGREGETRKLIQEVVGWVTAIGYTAKIKPEAYAASAVADRYTK